MLTPIFSAASEELNKRLLLETTEAFGSGDSF
jgi:hypothetical protein